MPETWPKGLVSSPVGRSSPEALARAGIRGDCQSGYNVSTSSGFGRGSSEASQNRQLEGDPPRQAAA